MNWLQKEKWGMFFRTVIWTVLVAFTFESFGFQSTAYAQNYLQSLPLPGTMVNLSPAYAPVLMKGIKTYADNPFRFDFFIDPGQDKLDNKSIAQESNKLIKYFLASLTVPENDLWVNLSPYEKDRIMPQGFGVTEMGRDLLAQDYLLKQISASLLDPAKPKGEEFWKKIYEKANLAQGGNSAVNTFNKVWIVPDSAEVYTKDGSAFVVDSHLKVMLEEDLPALQKTTNKAQESLSSLPLDNAEKSRTLREIIIPAIEKEVNEGENFAMLRQIYHAMILATWFKRHLHQSLLSKIYVGQNKVSGVDVDDKQIKERIYQQYLDAFKKGVFNFIREDFDEVSQESVPRKYFAGGVSFTNFAPLAGSSAVSPYRETDNQESLRALKLGSVGFLGETFYRVSSVVVNGQGVNWYNSMNLTAPASAASTVISSQKVAPVLSVRKLFSKLSLRKAAGITFATVALFSSLGFANQAQGAQFSYDGHRGMIVHIEKGDSLGSIVQTLKTHESQVNPALLSGKLWGNGGAVEKVAQAMHLSDKDTIIAGKSYAIPASFLTPTDVRISASKPTVEIPALGGSIAKNPAVALVNPIPSIVPPIARIVPSVPRIVPALPNLVEPISRTDAKNSHSLFATQYPIDISWLNNIDIKELMPSVDDWHTSLQEASTRNSLTAGGLILATFGLSALLFRLFRNKEKIRFFVESGQSRTYLPSEDLQVLETVSIAEKNVKDFVSNDPTPSVPTKEELAYGDGLQTDFISTSHEPVLPNLDEEVRAQQILAQDRQLSSPDINTTGDNASLPKSKTGLGRNLRNVSKWALAGIMGIGLVAIILQVIGYFTLGDHTINQMFQWYLIGCGNFGIYWVVDENEPLTSPVEDFYPLWVRGLLSRQIEGLSLRGGESLGMSGFGWWLSKKVSVAIMAKVLKAKRGGDLFESADKLYRASVKRAVAKSVVVYPSSHVRGVTGHVRLPTGGPSLLEAAHPFTTTDNTFASGLFGLWRDGEGSFSVDNIWEIRSGKFVSQLDRMIVSIAANGDNLKTVPRLRFAQADPDGSQLVDKLIATGRLESVSPTMVRLIRNEDGSAIRPPELKLAQYDELWEDLQRSDLKATVFGHELDTKQLRDYYAAIYQYELGDAYQWVKERDEHGQLQEPHRIVNGDSPPIALQILFGLTQGNWKASLRYAYTNAIHHNRQEVVDNVMDLNKIDLITKVVEEVFAVHALSLSRPGLTKTDKNYRDLWVTQEMVDSDSRWRGQFDALQSFRQDLLKRFHALRDEVELNQAVSQEGIVIRGWRHKDDESLKIFVDLLVERFFIGDRPTAVQEFAQAAQGTFGVQVKDSLHPDSFTLYSNRQGLAIGYSRKGRYVEFSSEHWAMMYDHSPKDPLENIILLDSEAPGQMADVTVYDNKQGPLFSLDVYSFAKGRYLTQEEINENSYPQTEDNPYFRKPLVYEDPRNKTTEDLQKILPGVLELRQQWNDENSHFRRSAKAMLDKFVSRDLEIYLKTNSLVYGRIQGEVIRNLSVIIDNSIDTATPQGKETKARILHQVQNGSVILYLKDYLDRIIEQEADQLSRRMISHEITENDLPDIQTQFEQSLQAQFYKELKRIFERILDQHFDFFQQWLSDAIAKGEQGALIGAGEIDAFNTGYESSDKLGEALNTLYSVVFPAMRTLNLSSNEGLSLDGKNGVGRRSVAMVTSKSGGTSPSKEIISRLTHIMPGRVFASTSRSDTLIGFALGQKYLKVSPFCERIFYTGDYFPSEAVSAGEILLFANDIELVIYLAKQFRELYPHRRPFGMTMTNEEIKELERLADDLLTGEAARLTGMNAQAEKQETPEHQMLVKNGENVGKTLLEGPANNFIFRLFVFGIFMFGAPVANIFMSLSGMPLPPVSDALGFILRFADFIVAIGFQWMVTSWIYRFFSHRPRWARLTGTTLAVNDPSLLVRESQEMYAVKLGSMSPGSMHMHVLNTDPTDSLAAKLLPRITRGTLVLFGMPYDPDSEEQVGLSIQQTGAVKNGIFRQWMKAGAEIFVIFRGKDDKSLPVGVHHKMNIGANDIHLPTPNVLQFYKHSFDVYGRLIAGKVFLESAYRYATTFRFARWMFQIWDRSKTFFRTGVLSTAIPRMQSKRQIEHKGEDPFKDLSLKKNGADLTVPLSESSQETEPLISTQQSVNRQQASSALVPQATTLPAVSTPGGIDLNSNMLKINVTGDASEASSAVFDSPKFLLNPAELNAMPSDRFVPFIIEVVPVKSVDMFLSMASASSDRY